MTPREQMIDTILACAGLLLMFGLLIGRYAL